MPIHFKHVQDDGTNGMFIANSDTGSRVGYLIWGFPEENQNVIEICDLMIYCEEDRSKGIGSTLITLMPEYAKKLKVDEVMDLTSEVNKQLHTFYEKNGFSFTKPGRFMIKLISN